MVTTNKPNIDKKTIKTGAKIVGRTVVAIGKVVGTVIVTTIEILHDVIKDKGKE